MYYGVVDPFGRERMTNTLKEGKALAQTLADKSGDTINVYQKFDSGKTKALSARVYPSYKKNPAPKRAVRPSSFYSRPKYPYVIMGKDHPIGNTVRFSTETEARKAALRLADLYGVPVKVTVTDTVEEKVYSRNPAPSLSDGSGSWIVTRKDTGEAVRELWTKSAADKVNLTKYKVQTARAYLEGLNRTIKAKANPRGIGGIGYYSYTNPESGEKILDDDLERIKRTARKLANRLGRAIQVRADYSGKRVK